ncbi:MAG: zinc-binding alcohol dehydrogenase family protein [Solirubrobacterales bacterium]
MRAAVIESHERPPRAGDFEDPSATDGKSEIDVSVAGLNPVDLATAAGEIPGRQPPIPSIAGKEGIGVLPDGRRVYFDDPAAPFGSMAERSLVEADSLIDVPDGVDDDLAVCFGIAGLAAWLSLTWRADLQAGETVLVLGASGVVGQIAVQGAGLLGAGTVIAAARDTGALERSREIGADATVVVEEGEEMDERFREACGDGADVILDPIWGSAAAAALTALAENGRLVQIGNAAGPTAEIAGRPFRNQLGSIIGHTNFKAPADRKREAFRAMCEHAAAGELTVETEEVPLSEIEDAWRRQGEGPHHKLVIHPG